MYNRKIELADVLTHRGEFCTVWFRRSAEIEEISEQKKNWTIVDILKLEHIEELRVLDRLFIVFLLITPTGDGLLCTHMIADFENKYGDREDDDIQSDMDEARDLSQNGKYFDAAEILSQYIDEELALQSAIAFLEKG